MILDILVKRELHNHPEIKDKLKKAKMKISPIEFVKKTLKNTLIFTFCLGFVAFLVTKEDASIQVFALNIIGTIFVGYFLMKKFFILSIDSKIIKRGKEIDRGVIFAGRFLLVKLNSGVPLLNALEQAANSYGSGSYFKDIVDDIKLGTPIEEALEKAMESTPSERFSKILFQINNSLKIGVDVTDSLDSVLKDIAQEQLIEIKRYGKKLNSFTMFYMLIAVVIPSLGTAIISIFVALVAESNMMMYFYYLIIAVLAILQSLFIVMFKSIRPNVDL